MSSLLVGRFMRLPRRSDERWLAQSEFESLDDANRAIAERFQGSLDAMPSTAAWLAAAGGAG